ncbi:putative Zinc finger protein SHOOT GRAVITROPISM 5 [Helianthus annuus]|uniref:Zinc finger protein SHOOT GRAVITROPISM 5 n=1 Tax=Helianthus annuus TaxID=4232 RepID=A0A251UTP4_HELAN|nr:protein indeterminate-domain 14 [Helianthus annuus]KAF5806992.1 putative Zinc finger protein SHOOT GRAVITROPISM 5 [Helianthus annuus]KAJ0585529.1 putative Zinc finger protein SHOOT GRAVITROPISM 5 [Helianthus annuus]KAJ0920102.1 putative Zinc finger protein SHOOT GRAVITROPISM 5 [Helianthus annuus]KAJ0923778.1 putative Zinc finger protein SHOOT GRAVITROPISM 5 [Helianthus annuus]
MENDLKELQLLPIPCTTPSYSRTSPWSSDLMTFQSNNLEYPLDGDLGLSLDLQLSTSLRPIKPSLGTETRKWRGTDQIRIAAMESAYAKRVMEMTQREMEMAQSEFARARHIWERVREEVERVEKMKERATRRVESCMEITCQACRRKFRRY